jgi:hypothetical protein
VASYLASWDKAEASSSGKGASTRGGEWVVLEGRNFGTAAESRVSSVAYEVAGNGRGYQETFHSCKKADNPRAAANNAPVSAFVGAPTKGGYYFHASTTPACVCGTYGYEYSGGAVDYTTAEVLVTSETSAREVVIPYRHKMGATSSVHVEFEHLVCSRISLVTLLLCHFSPLLQTTHASRCVTSTTAATPSQTWAAATTCKPSGRSSAPCPKRR